MIFLDFRRAPFIRVRLVCALRVGYADPLVQKYHPRFIGGLVASSLGCTAIDPLLDFIAFEPYLTLVGVFGVQIGILIFFIPPISIISSSEHPAARTHQVPTPQTYFGAVELTSRSGFKPPSRGNVDRPNRKAARGEHRKHGCAEAGP